MKNELYGIFKITDSSSNDASIANGMFGNLFGSTSTATTNGASITLYGTKLYGTFEEASKIAKDASLKLSTEIAEKTIKKMLEFPNLYGNIDNIEDPNAVFGSVNLIVLEIPGFYTHGVQLKDIDLDKLRKEVEDGKK